MSNPIFAEVTRGGVVESVHRGAICVVDGDGHTVFTSGDVEKPVYPRSAVKAIQALPLVESGAADAFGLDDKNLALACASHSGEAAHIAVARDTLERSGLDESCLECGGHFSLQQSVALEQARHQAETPPAICNNCSGKHAGFLATCAHEHDDVRGYVKAGHPAMERARLAMENVTGAHHRQELSGTDGCSIPTYAIPLNAMALGFARMVTGLGLGADRANAAKRLINACMAEPFYVAGTDRFCTNYMALGGGRLFAKTGAEGVFCGAIPELGLGIALKCDDGTTRAAEAAMAAITAHLLPKDDALQPGLAPMVHKTMHNWNGIEVGAIRGIV